MSRLMNVDEPTLLSVTAREFRQPPEPEEVSLFGDVLPAAFRLENTLASFATGGLPDLAVRDPEFDPFADIEGYEDYADAFVFADSPQEVARVKGRIDQEIRDRETLAAAGAPGIAATMAAGFLDPLILLPVGGAIQAGKGAQVLARGIQTARAGFLGASAAELALQASQDTRTLGESALNVTASTVLSAALGSAAGALGARRARFLQQIQDDLGETDTAPFPIAGGSGRADPRKFGVSPEDVAAGNVELKLASAFGAEKVAAALGMSPNLRVMVRSQSMAARRTLLNLVDVPARLTSEAEGIATPVSAENAILGWRGPEGAVLKLRDEAFVRHRTGKAGGGVVRRTGVQARDFANRLRRQPREEEKLTLGEFNREWGRAMRRGDRHEIPEVQEVAQAARRLVYDPLLERLKAQGRLPEDLETVTAESYLTRLYNHPRLVDNEAQFRVETARWLRTRHPEMKVDEANTAAQQIMERILGIGDGRTLYEPVRFTGTQSLRERTFTIPDEALERLGVLEDDGELLLRSYIRTVGSDVEIADALRIDGDLDDLQGSAAFREIVEEYSEKIKNAKSRKERQALHAQRQSDLEDLEAMVKLLRGTYSTSSADSPLVRAGRGIRRANFITIGGGFMLSAIPDMGRLVMVNGLSRTYRAALRPLIRDLRALNMSKRELQLAGEALDLVLDSRAQVLADIGDAFGRHSRFERSLESASNTFGVVSGLAPWNAAMKTLAGATTQTRIGEVAEALANGNAIRKADRSAMAHFGLDDAMMRRIASQPWEKRGSLMLANTEQWTDAGVVQAYRAALRKSVNEIIVTPGVSDRPRWMSTDMGKLVGQFKSFAFASVNRTFIPALQQRDLAIANGTAISLGLGALVYAIKSKIADRPLSEEPQVWVAEAVDRSGLLGAITELNNIVEKTTRGTIGINAVMGGPVLSRYASRNVMGAILGPTAGQFEDFVTSVGAASTGEWLQSDTERIRRLAPYQNLWYFNQLFDRLEEGANEAFGIPEKR